MRMEDQMSALCDNLRATQKQVIVVQDHPNTECLSFHVTGELNQIWFENGKLEADRYDEKKNTVVDPLYELFTQIPGVKTFHSCMDRHELMVIKLATADWRGITEAILLGLKSRYPNPNRVEVRFKQHGNSQSKAQAGLVLALTRIAEMSPDSTTAAGTAIRIANEAISGFVKTTTFNAFLDEHYSGLMGGDRFIQPDALEIEMGERSYEVWSGWNEDADRGAEPSIVERYYTVEEAREVCRAICANHVEYAFIRNRHTQEKIE